MAAKAIGSFIAVLVAEITPEANKVMELHVPPIVMEIFQCIAWASAGVLATLAIIKHYKRRIG